VSNEGELRRAELSANAVTLARSVATLNDSINGLMRRTARSERAIAMTVIGLLLDVALTVVAAYLVWGQYATQNRVDSVCPLYGYILGSYNPSTRNAGPDRDAYNESFSEMRAGYINLQCTSPIVPPRITP